MATAAVALLVAPTAASAHVTIDGATANDDGTTTFTLSFDHGCEGSPTVELHVQLPDAAEMVATTQPDGWAAAPGSDHSVRWTGPPIAAGDLGTFTLTTNRFGRAGDTILFPTVQRCVEGEHAWINRDQASDEPAPFVVLDARTAKEPPATDAPAASPSPAGGDGASNLQVAIIVVGAACCAAAAGAAAGRRRRIEASPRPDAIG